MKYDKIDKAIDEIRHYFNMNLNETDVKRLRSIITEATPVVTETKILIKRVVDKVTTTKKVYVFPDNDKEHPKNPPIDVLDKLTKEVCDKYNISPGLFRTPVNEGGTKRAEFVKARGEFIRTIYLQYNAEDAYIASYLGMERSTVIHHRDGGYDRKKMYLFRKSKMKKHGQNT